MKPHTPDQVAAMKKFADSQPSGAERKTYALNGLEVTYTTVDMGDAKPFDYAVAAFVAPREDGEPITEADYTIAVSDDVPEPLRGLWAWHELNDFAVLGHEADNRCLTSEQELATSMSSDPELYQQYLSVRIPFYDGLADFIVKDLKQEGNGSVYNPADLKGCYDALAFLQAQKSKLQEAEKTTTPSILDLAKVKRAELGALATQEAIRIREKAEQDRIAKEKEAELKLESDSKAAEFIQLMKDHNVEPVKFYRQLARYVDSEAISHHWRNGTTWRLIYAIDTEEIGEGWIIHEQKDHYRAKGLILLTNRDTYSCYKAIVDPSKYSEGYLTKFQKGHGFQSISDKPLISAVRDSEITSTYPDHRQYIRPLEHPYAHTHHEHVSYRSNYINYLLETLIKLGIS